MAGLFDLNRLKRAPLLVLLLVLLLSAVLAAVVNGFVHEQQRSRFERETLSLTNALQDRMNDYIRLLRTARAAWQVHPNMLDEQTFKTFVGGVNLKNRYPGVQAMGFATWVEDGDAAPLVARLRRSGLKDFAVRQASTPQGALAVISVIAPDTPENRQALGFDFNSDDIRRAALQAARQGNAVHSTRRVELIQHEAQGRALAGFLLMLPVWQGEHQDALQGYIYLAVRADELLSSLQSDAERSVKPAGEIEMQAMLAGEWLSDGRLPGDLTQRQQVTLTLAGQPWTVRYAAPAGFGQDFAAIIPLLTVLSGMLVAGLAFLLVQAQVNARLRAEGLLASLNATRAQQEQASAEFQAIFNSMQDAAAFTDASGNIRLVNPALHEQFRVAPHTLIGGTLSSLHLDDRLSARETFQAITTPYRRSDGSIFSGEAQRSEVFDPQGQRLGLLEVIRDVSERVAAERAVQAAERRYRDVLDAIPHVLEVSNPGGQVTYVNAQHQARVGEAALKTRLAPEVQPAFEALWQDALERQAGAQGELPITLADGQRRWFDVQVVPIRDAQGDLSEWVTSATDVHDRVTAEKLAQRNEERYRSVLEGLPQIVWLTDPQGRAVYRNRRWEEYVGQERAGQSFLSLLHPDDREPYGQRWQAALRSTRPFEAEHRLLSAQGEYRHFVTRGLPVLDSAGQVLEWVGTSTDVDDSVYAENSARLLADVSEDLAARKDGLGSRVGSYQAALRRITSRFADSAALWFTDPLQLQASAFMHPNWQVPHMRQAIEQVVERVIKEQDPVFIRAHPLLHSVNATGALLFPLLAQNGQVCGVLAFAYRQQLTDRDQDLAQELAERFANAVESDLLQQQVREAQADLQSLNQSLEERVEQRTLELESANKELEAFSYSVSHDLRTPLRHIVGFGNLLHKELSGAAGAAAPPSAKTERYLGIITDSATRMSQLIDDLLEFSRMGRQELRLEAVNLHDLIAARWQELEPDRQGRDVQLVMEGTLPVIQGDAAMLGLVFSNLLSNAVKYTRTREHAVIRVQGVRAAQGAHDGGNVTIHVQDNGVGFDVKYADKLFGVFQRLHRNEEFEGIGIGLANVRRIVNRHGGQVSATAELDRGATFSVTLPVRGRP